MSLLGPRSPHEDQTKSHDPDGVTTQDKKAIPPSATPENPADTTADRKTTPPEKESHPPQSAGPWWKTSEWILVFITMAYVVISGITLGAILWQGIIANKSVNAVMDAGCGRVFIKGQPGWVHRRNKTIPTISSMEFQWKAHNKGTTPIFVYRISHRFMLIEDFQCLSPRPDYPKIKSLLSLTVRLTQISRSRIRTGAVPPNLRY